MTSDGVAFGVVAEVMAAIVGAWAICYGIVSVLDFFRRVVGR